MIRDLRSTTRCTIKLASLLRKQALSDAGKRIVGHSLIGAGGGLVIGSTVGKDNKSPVIGAGMGAAVGGISGAVDHYLRRAVEAKKVFDAEQAKQDVARLQQALGDLKLSDLEQSVFIDTLKKRMEA